MRSGGVLQRRLLKLESTFKVPDAQRVRDQIVSQALSNLSLEELHLLRDGAMQAPGVALLSNPEYEEVLQRANAICVQALAEHSAFTRAPGSR